MMQSKLSLHETEEARKLPKIRMDGNMQPLTLA
jgi:hypothetical protein